MRMGRTCKKIDAGCCRPMQRRPCREKPAVALDWSWRTLSACAPSPAARVGAQWRAPRRASGEARPARAIGDDLLQDLGHRRSRSLSARVQISEGGRGLCGW